jgi:hypothetical protein
MDSFPGEAHTVLDPPGHRINAHHDDVLSPADPEANLEVLGTHKARKDAALRGADNYERR